MDWSDEDAKLFRSVGGIEIQRGPEEETEWNFGWFPVDPLIDPREASRPPKSLMDVAPQLAGSGEGRTVLLYEACRKVLKRDPDTGPQQTGDCVGWGFAIAVDVLACIEIVAGEHESYSWTKIASPEAIYAFSREIGHVHGRRAGSSSVWAAAAIQEFGTLSREVTGPYSGRRSDDWGRNWVPKGLRAEARKHIVQTATLVTTFAEARDAIANGFPVAIGSNQGFVTQRDHDGFCAPKSKWSHCMKFVATKDDERPGLLCMNNWGDQSPPGPTGKHNIPAGSFWVDAAVCERMLGQGGGFALAGFSGYHERAARLEKLLTPSSEPA